MLWCAGNREKSKTRLEGKAVLVPQFEMEEEVVDARVGLEAPSMQVESKVEARVGADDAQPDDEHGPHLREGPRCRQAGRTQAS